MKKKILFILVFLFLFASLANAQVGLRTSGVKAADAVILAVRGYFYGIEIITDGTNSAAVIVYDNATAASGTVVFKGTVPGASNFGGALFIQPVEMFNGIYVDMTGTGMNYIVYYKIK